MSLTDEDKQWITERLERVESTFSDKLERVETTLLTEFHKWSSPIEMRLRTHSAALRASDLELEAVADRVTKLEAR
jgi:ribosome-associated translation inhibitor RaiA